MGGPTQKWKEQSKCDVLGLLPEETHLTRVLQHPDIGLRLPSWAPPHESVEQASPKASSTIDYLPRSGTRVQAGRQVGHALHSGTQIQAVVVFMDKNPELSASTNLLGAEGGAPSLRFQSLILPVLIHSASSNQNWSSPGWLSTWLGSGITGHEPPACRPAQPATENTMVVSLLLPSLEGHTAPRNQSGIPSPALLRAVTGALLSPDLPTHFQRVSNGRKFFHCELKSAFLQRSLLSRGSALWHDSEEDPFLFPFGKFLCLGTFLNPDPSLLGGH